jgi:hypothetical protein
LSSKATTVIAKGYTASTGNAIQLGNVVRDAAIKPTANVLTTITVTCMPNNTKIVLSKSVLEMYY